MSEVQFSLTGTPTIHITVLIAYPHGCKPFDVGDTRDLEHACASPGECNVMMGLMPASKHPLGLLLGVTKPLFHEAAECLHFLSIGLFGKMEWLGKVNHLSREG